MFIISVVCDGQMQLGSLEWWHKVIYFRTIQEFGAGKFLNFFKEINIFIQKVCIKLIPDSHNI